MGLEDIEAKIRGQGKRQADEIRLKARDEMDGISKQYEVEGRQKCDKIAVDYKKKSAALVRGILSTARLQASNLVAMEKSRIIESVFDSARNEVLKLLAEGKKKILAAMLEGKSLIDGKPVVLIEAKYAGLLPKSGGIEVKTQDIGNFGLILTSKDGLIRIDKRLNTMLKDFSEKIKPDLCEILFKVT